MDEEYDDYELMINTKEVLEECFNIIRDDPDKEWTDLDYQIADLIESYTIKIEKKEQ